MTVDWVTGYASLAAEAAAFCAGALRWRRLNHGRRMIVAWLGASVLADGLAYTLGRRWHNTQGIGRVWFAASVVFALESLATFVRSRRWTRAFRGAIVIYLLVSVVLALTIEPLSAYSTYAAPLHSTLVLGAAVVVFFRRAVTTNDLLSRDAGAVIAAALAVYGAVGVLQTLVALLFLSSRPHEVAMYFAAANIINVFVVAALAWAVYLAQQSRGQASWQ